MIPTHEPKFMTLFVIQGQYEQGWKDLDDAVTEADAQIILKNYRENEPEYLHRLVPRRIRNPRYVEANPESE